MSKLSTAEIKSVIDDLKRGIKKADVRRKYALTKSQVTYYASRASNEQVNDLQKEQLDRKHKDFTEEQEPLIEETEKAKAPLETPKVEEVEQFQCGTCSFLFQQKYSYCPQCGVQFKWQ